MVHHQAQEVLTLVVWYARRGGRRGVRVHEGEDFKGAG